MNRPALVVPLVFLVCVLGSIGQALLKVALNRIPQGVGVARAVAVLLREPVFYGGGAVVAAGTLTYLFVLSRAHLTYAAPFLAFSFISTMVASALILGEPQPMTRVLGTLVIVVGMLIVGFSR